MKSERQKCLDGENFNGGDPELAAMTINAKRIIHRLNITDYADTATRRQLFEQLFGRIGPDVHIDIDFHCEYGKHILIGNRTIINMNCTFVDINIVEIGNDVFIASIVQIYTATQSNVVSERIVPDWNTGNGICHTYALPVKICDGAWIGGGTVILPGVTIGRKSVIGAGSVVTRSIPDNCVAVGNPCRMIHRIENGE